MGDHPRRLLYFRSFHRPFCPRAIPPTTVNLESEQDMTKALEKKKELIGKLRDAKKAHRRWVSNAQILMQGVPVKNEQLPLNETECGFGHWYYGEGQALRSYPIFRQIEAPHTALHATYLQIFDLLFRERKVSLFSRMLGKKAEPSAGELERAKKLFTVLNAESIKIMALLDELADLIISMDDKDFERLF